MKKQVRKESTEYNEFTMGDETTKKTRNDTTVLRYADNSAGYSHTAKTLIA